MINRLRVKLAIVSAMAIAALLFLAMPVHAQPEARVFGPSSVVAQHTHEWSCDIEYNAWSWYPADYGLTYIFTFERPVFSQPTSTGGEGPIVTIGFLSASDPNSGHNSWNRAGFAVVHMWPWQSVTQREDAESDGLTPISDAVINCTTGLGHEHDDNDEKEVNIHY